MEISDYSEATKSESTAVGYFAKTTCQDGTAIGKGAESIGDYSVAIGSYSAAEEAKVVSFGDGSSNSTYGTRRLVNVKDPVNSQDAATKNYVDSKMVILNAILPTSEWTTVDTTTEIVPGTIHYIQQVNILGIKELLMSSKISEVKHR